MEDVSIILIALIMYRHKVDDVDRVDPIIDAFLDVYHQLLYDNYMEV